MRFTDYDITTLKWSLYLISIVIMIVLGGITYAVPPTPTAYWFSDNFMNDSRGNSNITATENVTLLEGKVGQAYYYNNSYAKTVNHSSTNVTGALSISGWFYINSTKQSRIISKNMAYMCQIGATFNLQCGTWVGTSFTNYVTNSNPLEAGQWYFFAYTFNRTGTGVEKAKLYINGARNSTNDVSGLIANNNNSIYFGDVGDGTRAFNGTIDEIGLWNNYILTDEGCDNSETCGGDVAYLYNLGRGVSYPFPTPVRHLYVNQSGSDLNNGSREFPIKTLKRLNELLRQGYNTSYNYTSYNVSFNRGDTWNTITDNRTLLFSNMIIDSYGIGEKPIFTGALNKTDASWTNASYVWNLTGLNQDVASIVFNQSSLFGTGFGGGNKTKTYATLKLKKENRSFYYNPTLDTLSVYYEGNLTGDHFDIELVTTYYDYADIGMFDYGGLSNITIKDIDTRNGAVYAFHGIGLRPQYNINIFNVTSSFFGGGFHISSGIRFGNNFDCSLGCININFSYNRVTQGYDSCIGIQSWDTGGAQVMSNITISYNIVTKCPNLLELFSANSGSTFNNVTIEHNTLVQQEYGWSYLQRNGVYPRDMQLSAAPTNTHGWIIKDNIMTSSYSWIFNLGDFVTTKWNGDYPSIQDYNLYYGGGTNYLNYETSYYTIPTVNAALGYEAHGVRASPLFNCINMTNTSCFQLMANSPANGTASDGTNIGAWQQSILSGATPETLTPPVVDSITANNTEPDSDENVTVTYCVSATNLSASRLAEDLDGTLNNVTYNSIEGNTSYCADWNITFTNQSHTVNFHVWVNDTQGAVAISTYSLTSKSCRNLTGSINLLSSTSFCEYDYSSVITPIVIRNLHSSMIRINLTYPINTIQAIFRSNSTITNSYLLMPLYYNEQVVLT